MILRRIVIRNAICVAAAVQLAVVHSLVFAVLFSADKFELTVAWFRITELFADSTHTAVSTPGHPPRYCFYLGETYISYYAPPVGQGALSNDARLTSVCLTSVYRVHLA